MGATRGDRKGELRGRGRDGEERGGGSGQANGGKAIPLAYEMTVRLYRAAMSSMVMLLFLYACLSF
jgi:hypothetical protein